MSKGALRVLLTRLTWAIQIGTQQLTSKPSLVSGVMGRRKNVSHLHVSPLSPRELKKICLGFVYRFISTGTIEEKIFQRQANKQALSSAVVDEKEDTERHFSLDALRQLFQFNQNTLCETHDTFKCKRCKHGKQVIKSPALLYGDASTWNHFTNGELKNNHDDLLRAEVGLPEVSFVFQYVSH